MEMVSLFCMLAGFVIGLGAVTVIDIHGFLGRTSPYWTLATTRTHKVTKPLIWIGITLVTIGGYFFYRTVGFSWVSTVHVVSLFFLVVNGCFLSFSVSPALLRREREGKDMEILPHAWQKKITIALIISDVLWWGNLVLLALTLTR